MIKLLKAVWATISNLARGLAVGLGIVKFPGPRYKDSDEQAFLDSIPEGETFVFLVSDRHIQPFKRWWFDFMDFLRGAIQGVTGYYWQHCGIGRKINGKVKILESLNKIESGNLSKYLKPEFQLLAYFPFWGKESSESVWERACSQEGRKYDNLELVRHASPILKWLLPNSRDKFVCSSYAGWCFAIRYRIVPEKVDIHEAVPGHIDVQLRPDPKATARAYNFKLVREEMRHA